MIVFFKVIYITYLTLNMIKQIVYNPQKKHDISNIALDICMLTEIIVFVTTAIVQKIVNSLLTVSQQTEYNY